MQKILLSISFLGLALSLALPANAGMPKIHPPAASIPVIDPAALPSMPELTLNDDWMDNLQIIPLPDFTIIPELLQGPEISDIQMSSDGALLLISWKTDDEATSKVEYGETATYSKSLEDKNLVTDHSVVIPASAGTLHLQIVSEDSAERESASGDITILIPNMPTAATEDLEEPDATSTDPATATTTELEEMTEPEHTEDLVATSTEKVLLDTNEQGVPTLAKNQDDKQTLSLTETILGGIALLLAGILIGVLVNRTKKSKE